MTYPAINVWEDNDRVHVEAELPGMNLEDLEIHITSGNQLSIKGERKQAAPQEGVWHRRERNFGSFARTFTLPYAVDADKVDARFENGVLKLSLPKHESARPRRLWSRVDKWRGCQRRACAWHTPPV